MNKAQPIQMMTYYQSTIRNIGLYTSVSFGTLAISRYYLGTSRCLALFPTI